MALNAAELRRFSEDGYLVIPAFKSREETAALRGRAGEIVAAFDPSGNRSVFSTRDESVKSDEYFLTSGDKIRCFFEEEAFDASGDLARPKDRSINKIGHAMHDLDPVFDAFSHGTRLHDVAVDLGLPNPRVYQSMYIFKQPEIGGEVRWHQDATYFYTEPAGVITFWFALQRADRSNGCLWVEPGGHRGPLRERFAVENGKGRLEVLDSRPWPELSEAQPVEVDEGALVVFHALLPHYSSANRSPVSRHAYTLHAVDASVDYPATNWLQRGPAMPARGFV